MHKRGYVLFLVIGSSHHGGLCCCDRVYISSLCRVYLLPWLSVESGC